VLLGLPGAGKSTIGPLVASALGRPFVDLDQAIERREGCTVADLFATRGEPAFRAAERSLTAEILAEGTSPVVLSPGGGWIEDPANRAWLQSTSAAVYLRVSRTTALARMGPDVSLRPLLAGADPAHGLAELLARREVFYLQAEYTLSNDMLTPDQAASSIVALASREIGD
jgi:shikimate kinase